MYQIFFNDTLLYDPRSEELVIRNPYCHLAVGESGELTFQIDDDHPCASLLTRLTGIVDLQADGLTIFEGRIRKDSRDFDLTRTIEVEGLLACLNDSVIGPYDFPTNFPEASAAANVVEYFLGWVLAQHNGQVGAEQRIELGEVTVTDPNNYIARSCSGYQTAMEVVKGALVDTLGGYLLMDYSGDVPVLNYYDDLPHTNEQVVEFGENLLDLVTETDATATYTAILPVGADGLTIAGLEDGELSPGYIKEGAIIYSVAAEEQYNGVRITRKVEWNDVTVAANLQNKALVRLSTDGVKVAKSITVKAVDLGGGDISRFIVGRYVTLHSAPHGYSASYPLMELNPDILDPGETEITLGTTVLSASDLANISARDVQERFNESQAFYLATLNTALQNSSGLYTTQAVQADGSTIFYLHDRQTLEGSTVVIKINAEAIGISTDGGQNYATGLTVDGDAIVRILSATGVNADWINAGVLQGIKIIGEEGAIGGFTMSGNALSATFRRDFTVYTTEEITAIQTKLTQVSAGIAAWTEQELYDYDLNMDGRINSVDLFIMNRMANGLEDTYTEGRVIIDSADLRNCIRIEVTGGYRAGEAVCIGLGGISANKVNADRYYCGEASGYNGEVVVGDKTLTITGGIITGVS